MLVDSLPPSVLLFRTLDHVPREVLHAFCQVVLVPVVQDPVVDKQYAEVCSYDERVSRPAIADKADHCLDQRLPRFSIDGQRV